jgi:hypothetical protein
MSALCGLIWCAIAGLLRSRAALKLKSLSFDTSTRAASRPQLSVLGAAFEVVPGLVQGIAPHGTDAHAREGGGESAGTLNPREVHAREQYCSEMH